LWHRGRRLDSIAWPPAPAAEGSFPSSFRFAPSADDLNTHALVVPADLLERSGRRDEAWATTEQALELYEGKGNVVMAGRVRERLVG
jgi:hypothetical protein